jgi:hypothetical protein
VHGYAALVRVLGEARTDDEGATRSRSLPAARGHRPKDQTPSLKGSESTNRQSRSRR